MPDTFPDLASLITINDRNLFSRLANNLRQRTPFLNAQIAIPASNGTVHQWLTRTAPPATGFRAVNNGLAKGPSTQTSNSISLEYLDASVIADVALARNYNSPVYGNGKDAWIQKESEEGFLAAMVGYENQVLNGTVGGSATGFEGLADALPTLATGGTAGSFDAKVINAGGTTGTLTSAYMVASSEESFYLTFGTGEGGFTQEAPSLQLVDGANSESHGAYYVDQGGYLGVAVGSIHAAVRIANIDIDAASTDTMTDDLFYQAFIKFNGTDSTPTHIVCHPLVWEQWRASRTATNIPGEPAPYAMTIAGVRVVPSTNSAVGETAIA